METCGRTQDGNGDSSGDGNGDEDNGNGNENEDRIGKGEREAKKRKKRQKNVVDANWETRRLGGKRKTCRKERVGPVAANPDNLESSKEAGGGSTRYSGLK